MCNTPFGECIDAPSCDRQKSLENHPYRVRHAIQSATAMYPIIAMKLARVEATNGS
jgi:hypothetical protein